MVTRYLLRHRTTGLFLAMVPSTAQPAVGDTRPPMLYVNEKADATKYVRMTTAELERLGLAEFADAHEVVSMQERTQNDIDKEIDEADAAAGRLDIDPD